MKKVYEWVLVISCITLIILYRDGIINFFINTFMIDTKVVVPKANKYKRTYDYVSFNYNETYEPYNIKDLENILFNVLNNGYTSFSFICPKRYNNCLEDIKSLTNDQFKVTMINNYVNPFNNFEYINTKTITLGNNNKISFEIDKLYNDDEIKEINNKIDNIFNDLKIDEIDNIRDKIKVFHDYLIDNVSYDDEKVKDGESQYQSNKAYGALIEGKAIGSGYSDAMALLLDRINVPNIKISTDNHIWNLVKIDDSWLHIDVTWDDTDNVNQRSAYFLIDTKKLLELDSNNHNFNEKFYLETSN